MIFLIGVFFFVNRDRVPISIPLAAFLIAATTALHKLPDTRFYYSPVIAYVVFVLAYHPKLYFAAFLNRLGDYSYGLYIYAFPTQQLIAHMHRDIRALPLFFFAFPCVLATAVLSWTFIEKPMLSLKTLSLKSKANPAPPERTLHGDA